MTELDISNNEKIKELILKYFSLKKSSRDFVFNRIDNPIEDTDPFIRDMFKDSPDGRLRFDIPLDYFADQDKGFFVFKEMFEKLLNRHNIECSYGDFVENKITYQNNKIKIQKLITNLIKQEIKEDMELGKHSIKNIFNLSSYDLQNCGAVSGLISTYEKSLEKIFILSEYVDNEFPSFYEKTVGDVIENNFENFLKAMRTYNEIRENTNKLGEDFIKLQKSIIFNSEDYDKNKIKNFILEELGPLIKSFFEIIGTLKIPKDNKPQVVLSINFADWFLCSSAEKWGSCLNLESDYRSAFWTGLPALLGDPNRIMIYVTDKEKKEYLNIKVDKIIARTWSLLSNNDDFHTVRWYPGKQYKNTLIKKVINESIYFPLRVKEGIDFRTKNSITPIYHTNGCASFIYFDNSTLNDDLTISAGSSYGSDCYYLYEDNVENGSAFEFENIECGLLSIMDSGCDVINYDGSCFYCQCCNETYSHHHSNSHDTAIDGLVCSNCFNNYYHLCAHNNDYYHEDEMFKDVNGNWVHEDHEGDYIEIDESFYKKEDVAYLINEHKEVVIKPLSFIHELEGVTWISTEDIDRFPDNGIDEVYAYKDHCEFFSFTNEYMLSSEIIKLNDKKQIFLELSA